MQHESLIRRAATATIPTRYGGDFKLIVYENDVDEMKHVALVKGDITPEDEVLVRVHSECLTGDVFGSERCDCGDQLHKAMKMVAEAGKGVIVYMHQEGRGSVWSTRSRPTNSRSKGMIRWRPISPSASRRI